MLKINLSRKCILFITSTILSSDLSYFIHSSLMNLSLGSAQCRSLSDRTMRKKFQFELKFNQASCLEYVIVKTIGFLFPIWEGHRSFHVYPESAQPVIPPGKLHLANQEPKILELSVTRNMKGF